MLCRGEQIGGRDEVWGLGREGRNCQVTGGTIGDGDGRAVIVENRQARRIEQKGGRGQAAIATRDRHTGLRDNSRETAEHKRERKKRMKEHTADHGACVARRIGGAKPQ